MPSLLKRLSVSGKPDSYEDEKKDKTEVHRPATVLEVSAPPSYSAEAQQPEAVDVEDLNEAFAKLNVEAEPKAFPDADICMAHLKLLNAFFDLKEEIGYTDGIFDLWDSRVPGTEESVAGDDNARKLRDYALSKIREKRWALYVVRAADRFEVWWTNFLTTLEEQSGAVRLTQNMQTTAYMNDFVDGKPLAWTVDMLPPLDVLMVWHSFMLNPRNYLEDCLRYGLKNVWATGIPWQAVDNSIDTQFNYSVTRNAEETFHGLTGRPWNLRDEEGNKIFKCPRCSAKIRAPWTTCGNEQKNIDVDPSGLVGKGYGEKDFKIACNSCNLIVDHDVLRVAKFKKDTEDLLLNDRPMPGTIIFGTTGVPTGYTATEASTFHGSFPNRLIKVALKTQILDLFSGHSPTMTDVRDMIESAIGRVGIIHKVNETHQIRRKGNLNRQERLSIRKMMSRYWDAHQIFSMELAGAVIRQGVFVDKMRGLDWLHSPACANTMRRLLTKYARFMNIIALYRHDTAVPTLDVDLGWHTHQLSPQGYFKFCLKGTKSIFIDHDDKIDEDKLSTGFEWTSKTYEKLYNEIYSECSCWYCEAIRARHTSSLPSFLGASKHEKVADAFHDSGAANLCPPDKSAHISAHNAMPTEHAEIYARTIKHLQEVRQRQLDEAYDKACKRAIKKGRKPPEKKQFVEDRWGYGYYGYYPYMGAYIWMTPGLYYYPVMMPMGGGMYGACVSGACSAVVSGGACGGSGGCGGGCGGGGAGAGAGGGGCGGGGGGCGGGGGGGGGGCGGGGS